MTQNYSQFQNTLSEQEPNWKEKACIIPIIKGVDQELLVSVNEKNELIGCWDIKNWTLFIGISQLIACTTGLATILLFGRDELTDLLMLYFDYEGNDKRDFFRWIVTFLISSFSYGIFWGFLLYLGAKYESVCVLKIWLIAEFLALIVTGVSSLLAVRAYIWDIEIPFFPPSTIFPMTSILIIGHLLGVGRFFLVSLAVLQGHSNSSFEAKDKSSCLNCDL